MFSKGPAAAQSSAVDSTTRSQAVGREAGAVVRTFIEPNTQGERSGWTHDQLGQLIQETETHSGLDYLISRINLILTVCSNTHLIPAASQTVTMQRLHSNIKQAQKFKKFRPSYPATLYDSINEYLGSGGGSTETAVDVSCGTVGERKTSPLTATFDRVIAVDVNRAQADQVRSNGQSSKVI